jgi:acetolactate synthase-1/2/3 large subunit
MGTIGTKGDRAGNFALQNSDLVLSLGSRLSVSTTGQDFPAFARGAKKVVVDINPVEHSKKTIEIDLFVQSNLKNFLESMHFVLINFTQNYNQQAWAETCQKWKKMWQTYSPDFAKSEKANLYYFIEVLTQKMRPDDILVGDAGSNMFVPAQGVRIRDSQRLIFSGGQTAMGFTIPACVGISFAKPGEVLGVCGDGSFQMNIHELQTIVHHKLPIKLFVLNNGGYLSMRNTQNNFFKRLTGATPETGVSFPELSRIAGAYGIKYMLAPNSASLPSVIQDALDYKGPVICEIMCLYDQTILTVASKQLPDGNFVSRPLEDMYPFLPREEFFREMIVKPLEASNE